MLYYINGGLTLIYKPAAFKSLLAEKARLTRISYYLQAYNIRKQSWEVIIQGENGPDVVTRKGCDICENITDHELSVHAMVIMAEDLLDELDEPCCKMLKAYYRGKANGTRVKEIAPGFGLSPNTFSARVRRCLAKLFKKPRFQALLKSCQADLALKN